jgi:DNA invertase Pin-like site-specific DNA recombinase
MRKIGYARVSSKDQNLDRQLIALADAGVKKQDIYTDKQSGKDFNRPAWRDMTENRIDAGDVLYIASLDRMGRDWDEISKEWNHIVNDLQADIVILDMPILDTRKSNDITGKLISKIVLELLSYVAQTEREKIKTRQREGIAAAKAAGKNIGGRDKPLPKNFDAICAQWAAGNLTAVDAQKALGMPPATFYRQVKKHGYKSPAYNARKRTGAAAEKQKEAIL